MSPNQQQIEEFCDIVQNWHEDVLLVESAIISSLEFLYVTITIKDRSIDFIASYTGGDCVEKYVYEQDIKHQILNEGKPSLILKYKTSIEKKFMILENYYHGIRTYLAATKIWMEKHEEILIKSEKFMVGYHVLTDLVDDMSKGAYRGRIIDFVGFTHK